MFIYLRERGKEREEEKHQCETETLTGCSPDGCAQTGNQPPSQRLSLSPSQRDAGLGPQQVRHVPTGAETERGARGPRKGCARVHVCARVCTHRLQKEGKEGNK